MPTRTVSATPRSCSRAPPNDSDSDDDGLLDDDPVRVRIQGSCVPTSAPSSRPSSSVSGSSGSKVFGCAYHGTDPLDLPAPVVPAVGGVGLAVLAGLLAAPAARRRARRVGA